MEISGDAIPCIALYSRFDGLLDNGENTSSLQAQFLNKNIESPQEYDWDSLLSTDENFLGVMETKQLMSKSDNTSVWRKIQKLNKSAIGPKNLELKQWKSSYYGLSDSESIRSRMVPSKFLCKIQINYLQIGSKISIKTNSISASLRNVSDSYKPKYRFVKGLRDKIRSLSPSNHYHK